MTSPRDAPVQSLHFYVTAPYPCNYLTGRQAQSLVATPSRLVDTEIYSVLIRNGFRRSGDYTYRPQCANCQGCVPVRLPVDRFIPSRSQRRAWKRHGHLDAEIMLPRFEAEHFALYCAYQKARHRDGGMDRDDAGKYQDFLVRTPVETRFVAFREQGVLRMVCAVDCVADGLSAVYTFYDCSTSDASYGTYAVLWLAEWCRQLALPYLYLGYWIGTSPKMAYKTSFRPLESFRDGIWSALPQPHAG